MTVTLRNMIVSGRFNRTFNLEEVAQKVPRVRYDPWSFSGAFIRLPPTIILFENGKFNIVGAHTLQDVEYAISWLMYHLSRAGYEVSEPTWQLRNCVAEVNLNEPINLDELKHAVYVPEQFPGATVRAEGKTLQVFSSGKVIVLGIKSLDELQHLEEFVREVIESERTRTE